MHAIEVPFERIDVRGPDPPERSKPGFDLLQRLRFQPVETALRVRGRFHDAGGPQHPQMLRHGRLRHPKLTLDLADRLLRREQQAQNRAAVRLGDDFEDGLHASKMRQRSYACHSIYNSRG